MSTVYVLHLAEDLDWVTTELLRPLPALGFRGWVSSAGTSDRSAAMERSTVVVAVVTKSALETPGFAEQAASAVAGPTPVVPVFLVPDGDVPPALRRLWGLPRIDEPAFGPGLWRQLDELLPPPDDRDTASTPIPWDVEAFSTLLAEAARHRDQSRLATLVDAFLRNDARPSPYPAAAANKDLDALRGYREFLLMRRYASAAGTRDLTVRRQLGQSFIELKEFDAAAEVLTRVVADTTGDETVQGRKERAEALGLMGRCHKQRYVDAGPARDDAWLATAITTYRSVFEESTESGDRKKLLWHGVNAASCILRAHRDGVAAPPVDDARAISEEILQVLRLREEAAPLDLWDSATRVEAQVDLGDFDAAAVSLERFLTHDQLKPFEVSSTYRQFDEVLQLAEDGRGAPILSRLAQAAARQRAGGIDAIGTDVRSLLVRVTDPGWAPSGVPDLTIHARLGTVLSVSGSGRTVAALLKDPQVINIEESRPAGSPECDRSVPFVGVAATYAGADGAAFGEDGGEALVAVIDDDIDVLHAAFRDGNGRPRIVGVWDQRDPSGPPPDGFTVGTHHTAADIVGYVEQGWAPPALSPAAEGHGTHVASIAVGRGSGEGPGKFAGGVAPGARLLMVISAGDGPNGYPTSSLEALAFINRTAESLDTPVVVNISQGGNAGAHDGTSAVEALFDEFSWSGRRPGRVVVKSAGNMRDRRGHALLTVPDRSAVNLPIRCQASTATTIQPVDTKVELWWDSANRYRFRLTAPTGARSVWARIENPNVERFFQPFGRSSLNLVQYHGDNGDSLLELRLAPGYQKTPTDWTLEVQATKVRTTSELHAWIERDERAEFLDHLAEEMTLTVPGTARNVITVGAIETATPVRVGRFSSYGPTRDRREKPDVCAPGVDVKAAGSGTGDGVVAMCGTSMAAPHVTGAIALLLSRKARSGEPVPTASQIGKALRQNTRNGNGGWDRGQGYGVVNVAALLRSF